VLTGVSPAELLILFAIILLLFGGSKVPQIARSLGRAVGEFRQAKDEIGISTLQEAKKELQEGMDVGQRVKRQILQEVKQAVGNVTDITVDPKDNGKDDGKEKQENKKT